MTDQELSYDNIVDCLLQKSPELRPLFDEHIQQYDELLPHVFFGDLTRYVMEQVSADGAGYGRGSSETVARIIDLLEKAMSSTDEKLHELVSVSFLENLDPSDSGYDTLKARLGPNLRRELDTYRR